MKFIWTSNGSSGLISTSPSSIKLFAKRSAAHQATTGIMTTAESD